MRRIRYAIFVLLLLIGTVGSVSAEVNIGIGINTPGVSIGINFPVFPQLVPIPGYPVYYAPTVSANYFFYDGMYWVFWDDIWYASSWYNGPWWPVEPAFVPLFVLRVPVRYYRAPPVYFRHWHSYSAPRWGDHWGPRWVERRRGWDRWNRNAVPARAPLPVYQRRYSGERYPRLEEQYQLRSRNYRYEPRTKVVRQHFEEQDRRRDSGRRERQERFEPRGGRERDMRGPAPMREKGAEDRRSEPRRDEERMRAVPVQRPPQERGPGGPAIREQRPQAGRDSRESRPERAPDFREQRPERGPAQREQGPRFEERGQRMERMESQEPGRGRGQGEPRGEGRGGGRGEERGGGRGGGRD